MFVVREVCWLVVFWVLVALLGRVYLPFVAKRRRIACSCSGKDARNGLRVVNKVDKIKED